MVDDITRQTSQLMRSHGAALVLFAQQWCATPEDVVQEAFLSLLRQTPFPDRPVAWLYRVVRNSSINASRAANRRNRHEGEKASRSPRWFAPAHDSRLDAESAQRALQALPEELREVVVARLWGGLSYEEIAELIGSSTSTAYRRYVQGLENLRTQLGVPCQTNITNEMVRR